MGKRKIAAVRQMVEAAGSLVKVRAVKSIQAELETAMAQAFERQGQAVIKLMNQRMRSAFAESASDDFEALYWDAAGMTEMLFTTPMERAASRGLSLGARNMAIRLGLRGSFSLTNPRAVAYLRAHGADLVSKINETTRDDLRRIVEQAVSEGWSYNQTALEISTRYREFAVGKPQEHIDSRAHLVAITEAGNAYEEGAYIQVAELQADGLSVKKSWSTIGDDRVSAECAANGAEGWIDFDQAHSSGDMHPLRFPGCRCDELYEVAK